MFEQNEEERKRRSWSRREGMASRGEQSRVARGGAYSHITTLLGTIT